MPLRTTLSVLLCLMLSLLVLSSCTITEPIEFGEERSRVISTVTDSLIIPGYVELETKLDSLLATAESFHNVSDAAKLELMKNQWLASLMAWEKACIYDFGPAVNTFGSLNTDIATFPIHESKIESSAAVGDTNTNDFDRDRRGFFAVEYLLFGDSAQAMLSPSGTKRRTYLLTVMRHLHKNVHDVRIAWGEYRTDFLKAIGTDAGSSMSLLFNAMNISYEHAKNFKIAVPAGRRMGQSLTPDLVEAYYSRNSIRALKHHIRSVFALWSGSEPAVHGFKYYLGYVPNGDRLIGDTENQMDTLNTVLDSFSDNDVLSDIIAAKDPRVDKLVEHSQKMSRFLKSELSSLMGIAITYSSGDGD